MVAPTAAAAATHPSIDQPTRRKIAVFEKYSDKFI
ncbi:hypothetical protein PC128_g18057 [Phytophthora cactorum]|nr:hypothetical protein PC128_g18057 [Phytophthora cactorum]